VLRDLVGRRATWSGVVAVGVTQVRRAMRSFRSTAETATRRSTAAVTLTPAAASTFSSLTTPTRCGGPRPSTTEYSTRNSQQRPPLVMGCTDNLTAYHPALVICSVHCSVYQILVIQGFQSTGLESQEIGKVMKNQGISL